MGSDSEAEKTAQKVKEKKLLLALAPIAKPLAGKKLSKRIFKLVRRGTFTIQCIRFGKSRYFYFTFLLWCGWLVYSDD